MQCAIFFTTAFTYFRLEQQNLSSAHPAFLTLLNQTYTSFNQEFREVFDHGEYFLLKWEKMVEKDLSWQSNVNSLQLTLL